MRRGWKQSLQGRIKDAGEHPRILQKAIGVPLLQEHVVAQPDHDTLGILRRSLAEAEERPDLSPVVLDRASLPVVLVPAPRRSLYLLHEIVESFRGHLGPGGWKSALGLEELQQHRESKPPGPALVHQQQMFAGRERPVFDQLFLGQLSLHRIRSLAASQIS